MQIVTSHCFFVRITTQPPSGLRWRGGFKEDLRSGLATASFNDADSSESAREFLCQRISALGEGLRVRYVLGDTGFYQLGFIKYLEEKGLKYIIAAPMIEIFAVENFKRDRGWGVLV